MKAVYWTLYYSPVNIVKVANKRLLKGHPSAISNFKKSTKKRL